ncbi:hypothetical protein GCM10017044_16320 [Kordiimonas sediminis]|uniref:HMG box domain-containing protein n=1 Tax=Kordiimonas sediminis TaxID=1735581 RepID=A0A919E894_9PROT|nr:hypothetical protein [Kordiimonas sediminis]GHF22697.1 hypothetical protein GCM10017044_16320 [Kordiimonas sediminis]
MRNSVRSVVTAVAALAFVGSASVSAFDHHGKDKDKKEMSEEMKAKWAKMSDEEKAAYKAKMKAKKEKWAKMSAEEKAAYKKEKMAKKKAEKMKKKTEEESET